MDGRLTAASLKAMINPGTVCGITGLLLIIAGVRLPDFLLTAVTYLGNAASPLALMAVGYTLMISNWRTTFGNVKVYVFSLVKLLVLPLVMLPVLRYLTDKHYSGMFLLNLRNHPVPERQGHHEAHVAAETVDSL